MKTVSEENKQLAQHLMKVFGKRPQVMTYSEDYSVALAICRDTPDSNITTYGTIGVSDYPLLKGGAEFPVRVEIVALCKQDQNTELFANTLVSVAYMIMKTGWLCSPGRILQNALTNEGTLSPHLKHFYFTAPSIWDREGELNQTMALKTKTVTWVMVIPISESERLYCQSHGDSAFEDLLEEKGVDIADLNREPAA